MELTWEYAQLWQDNANEGKECYNEPCWSWDCGFKLDFDGSMVSVSSRFYSPSENHISNWNGELNVLIYDEVIATKYFECKTLDELRTEVEEFTKHIKNIIKSKLIF